MTGAKLRDALERIRGLKEQYPNETYEQLSRRFQNELEGDQAMKRAPMRDILEHLLQVLAK